MQQDGKERIGKLRKGLEELRREFMILAVRQRESDQELSYANFDRSRTCEEAANELARAEPRETETEGGGSTWWLVCPECHGAVDGKDRWCRHCGQRLKNGEKEMKEDDL